MAAPDDQHVPHSATLSGILSDRVTISGHAPITDLMTRAETPGGRSDQAQGRSRRHRRAKGEKGAALVEFAILLPLLVMLLTGIFSGGAAYNQRLDMTHAAREGARWAATIPSTQTFNNSYVNPASDPGYTNNWQNGVRRYVVIRSGGTLTMANVCVSLVSGSTPTVVGGMSSATGGGACVTADPYPTSGTDTGRRVQVSVSRGGSIDLGVFPSVSFTMTSQAIAKSESTL